MILTNEEGVSDFPAGVKKTVLCIVNKFKISHFKKTHFILTTKKMLKMRGGGGGGRGTPEVYTMNIYNRVV